MDRRDVQPPSGLLRRPDCDEITSEADCMLQHAACKAITTPCGGFAGNTCAPSEYCAYVQECGQGDGSSICVPRPTSCEARDEPVCGCDGKSYANLCEAAKAGTGIERRGGC